MLYLLALSLLLSSSIHGDRLIFSQDHDDLSLITSQDLLENVLQTDGALAVTNLGVNCARALQSLKKNAPSCLENFPSYDLPDGSGRKTFATSSDQENEGHFPDCVKTESSILEGCFDKVDTKMSSLIMKIMGDEVEWTGEDGVVGNFSSAGYKEHLHVYTNNHQDGHDENDNDQYAAPFHTDNGLMLLLTPFQEHPLEIRNSQGELLVTSHLGDDSIIVILASALPNWLLKGSSSASKFFPAPHAVPSMSGNINSRTVFARMKVAPVSAKVSSEGQTFGEYFHMEDDNKISSLCEDPGRWSRLQRQMCEDGKAYCWMGCMELPSECEADVAVCVNQDDLPCCTETVTENCLDMDGSCEWTCPSRNMLL